MYFLIQKPWLKREVLLHWGSMLILLHVLWQFLRQLTQLRSVPEHHREEIRVLEQQEYSLEKEKFEKEPFPELVRIRFIPQELPSQVYWLHLRN